MGHEVAEPLFQLVHVDDAGELPPLESLGRFMARLRALPPDDYNLVAREDDGRGGSESWGCSARVGEDGSVEISLRFPRPEADC